MQQNGMKSIKEVRRDKFRESIANNIQTMSQRQIEEYWSDLEYQSEVAISQEMFLSTLEDKHFARARASILIDDVDALLDSLIKYCWMPENHVTRNDGLDIYIDPSELVVFLAKSKAFKDTGINQMLATSSMMNFVVALESILFDWASITIKLDSGIDGFYTKTYMKIGFVTELVESDFIFCNDFPLPIMGEPLDWQSGITGGGYLLSTEKPTLKLGEAEQPQNVLDVLNVMQNQTFNYSDDNTLAKYRAYIYKTQAKKLGLTSQQASESQKIKEIADNTTNTLQLHMDLMSGKDFSFQWKFDFRGRIYNTGYNFHLQSDKFKKAMLIPSASNFDKTYALAEKLSK